VGDVRKDIQKLKVPNWKTLAQELRCPNIFGHGTICNLVQGGSNMTGNDLCVNKPHCAEAV
jgi:hypothetical protein